MELQDLLVFIAGGAAVVVYYLMENVFALASLAPSAKRWAAYLLTAAIAVAAYLFQVVMLNQPAPVDWRGWVESTSAIAFGVIGLNQIIHGQARLGKTSQ
ncbi:MAG TPA: hypothetical protein VHS06_01925 [Chloroflexota bacterium]|nr:hypothetical protein [Chloroflexota bacterium]